MVEAKPPCKCRAEMVFMAENERVTIWHCQSCDRVLAQHKKLDWQHWYKPEK